MNEQTVIMVQVADPTWTWAVLRSACTLASASAGRVALVYTLCVKHPAYLGSTMGYIDLRHEDVCCLQAYSDEAVRYGVGCDITVYQAWSLFGAVVDAAELVGAHFVFAQPPASIIPLWGACQFELLRLRLARQGCKLYQAGSESPNALAPQPVLGVQPSRS